MLNKSSMCASELCKESIGLLIRAGLANVVALFSKTVGAQPLRITTKGHIKHVIFNESKNYQMILISSIIILRAFFLFVQYQ